MRIEWTAEAVAELDSMLAYIAAQDPSVASLVAERVLQAESGIRTFPRAGNYDAETDTFDRYIPKTRIVLSYAVQDDVIWIVAAWHTVTVRWSVFHLFLRPARGQDRAA